MDFPFVAQCATILAMNTWATNHMIIEGTKYRLDTLTADGKIAGWIVRRACNVFHAYLPPARLNTPEDGLGHDAVVDLLADGRLLGAAPDVEGARQLIENELDVHDSGIRPVPNFVHQVTHGEE